MRWFLPLILIISGIGGFFLVAEPIYTEALSLKEEADKYNEALANADLLKAERDRLTERYNSFLPEDLERLSKILPDSVNNVRLILEIQQVAQQNGILVQNVQFEPNQFIEEGGDDAQDQRRSGSNIRRPASSVSLDYDVFDLEFSIEGRYSDFVEFMKLMEKSLRIVDVRSIIFTPGTSEDRDSNYTDFYRYTFRINTYRLKDL